MKKIIKVPQHLIERKKLADEKVYLSDFMETFPSNCIFLKGATGIGGTSLALWDKIPSIIAMPFKNTVISKTKPNTKDNAEEIERKRWCLGVYGGVTQQDIWEYMETCYADGISPKICCTYDGIEKIEKVFSHLGYSTKGWRLLCDELHIMFNMYKLRRNAVRRLLKYASGFDNVVYMTATPIESKYLFEEIKDMDVVEIEYPSEGNLIELRKVRYLVPEVTEICKKHIEGRAYGNAHIFVNSVQFIIDVAKRAELTAENTRIVCSNYNDYNITKIKALDMEVASINSSSTTINFYTSTAFEGADIFDTKAQSYIVSDGRNRLTMVDISTTYIQILGRIRDCSNKKTIHIYTTTRNSNVTNEEFEARTEKNIQDGKEVMEKMNALKNLGKTFLSKEALNDKYIIMLEDGTLEFDPNLLNLEIINYKCVSQTYRSKQNLKAKLLQNGLEVNHSTGSISDALLAKPTTRTTLKERYTEYAGLHEEEGGLSICAEERIAVLDAKDKWLRPAYFELGTEEVVRLKYSPKRVKYAIHALSKTSQANKIVKMLGYEVGDVVSNASRLKRVEEIKEVLGITASIKIKDYYEIKDTTIRRKSQELEDGSIKTFAPENAMTIIRQKVIFK